MRLIEDYIMRVAQDGVKVELVSLHDANAALLRRLEVAESNVSMLVEVVGHLKAFIGRMEQGEEERVRRGIVKPATDEVSRRVLLAEREELTAQLMEMDTSPRIGSFEIRAAGIRKDELKTRLQIVEELIGEQNGSEPDSTH